MDSVTIDTVKYSGRIQDLSTTVVDEVDEHKSRGERYKSAYLRVREVAAEIPITRLFLYNDTHFCESTITSLPSLLFAAFVPVIVCRICGPSSLSAKFCKRHECKWSTV